MVVDGKEKEVMENEMSNSEEHNQNLSSPQSMTRNLRIRKVKEGDAASIPADASASKQKKKKNKTTLTTDGWQAVGEVLIALGTSTSKATLNHGGETHCSTQPPAPISALAVPDINQGDKVNLANAVVTVQGYRVKAEFAATVQCILKRHGDIVACTSFKGSMLPHLLQSVCVIYQKLEKSEFIDLTLADLEAMSIEVSDFLKINMNVGWLEKRLDDIVNSKKLHQSSTLIKDTKRQTQKVVVELENEFRIKEEAMHELQFKIEDIKEKLFREKTKLETLNRTIMEAEEKVKRFQKKSLVDEI